MLYRHNNQKSYMNINWIPVPKIAIRHCEGNLEMMNIDSL